MTHDTVWSGVDDMMAGFAGDKGGPELTEMDPRPPGETKTNQAKSYHPPARAGRQSPKTPRPIKPASLDGEKQDETDDVQEAIGHLFRHARARLGPARPERREPPGERP